VSPDAAFAPGDRPVVVVVVAQLPLVDHLAVDPRALEIDVRAAERVLTSTDREAVAAAIGLRDQAEGFLLVVALDEEGAAQGPGAHAVEGGVREALAMGADAGLILNVVGAARDAATRARLLAEAVRHLPRADLVLVPSVSDDPDWGLLPGMLAEMLDCGAVPAARNLEFHGDWVAGNALFGATTRRFETDTPAVLSIRPGGHRASWPTAWRVADAFHTLPIISWTLADLDTDGRLLSRLSAPAETRTLRVVRPEPPQPERFTDPPDMSARTLGKRLARKGYLGGF
jgi:electron transfer flavoprotein alpha/beta subunit